MILFTIDKPSPVPFFLVVKYGVKISSILLFKLLNPIPLSIRTIRIWSLLSKISIDIFLLKLGFLSDLC